jgi:ribosomal-protein-alanine N-acetyltransferase
VIAPVGRQKQAVHGQITIRPMRSRHLDGVHAIEKLVYPRPWSNDLFRAEMAQADRSFIVAATPGPRQPRRRDIVVGYGGIQMIANDAHLITVASHPAWRRLGIGAQLVVELIAAAAKRQAEAVTLEVRDSNHPARMLYAAFGFEDVGARPGYYADNREDARILWLHRLPADDVRATIVAEAKRRNLTVPAVLTRPR